MLIENALQIPNLEDEETQSQNNRDQTTAFFTCPCWLPHDWDTLNNKEELLLLGRFSVSDDLKHGIMSSYQCTMKI